MSNAAFLSLIFGGMLVIVASSTIVVLRRPHQTSFAGAMTLFGIVCGSAVLSKTGSYWWALGVVAFAVAAYFMLQHVVRHALRRVGRT